MKISAGSTFYNITVSRDGKWETISVPTTRKDKNGHLTRRSGFLIMSDVSGVIEKAKREGGQS